MTIGKNHFIGHLKTPITELHEVTVRLPRNGGTSCMLVGGYEIRELLRTYPLKRGIPQFASVTNGSMVTVFPRTDKRYRLRVVGTQFIEQ